MEIVSNLLSISFKVINISLIITLLFLFLDLKINKKDRLKKVVKSLILLDIIVIWLAYFSFICFMTLQVFDYNLTEYNKENYFGIRNYVYFISILNYLILSYIAYYFYIALKKGEGIRKTLSFLMKRVLFSILMVLQLMYTMVYFNTLFNSIKIIFIKYDSFFSSGYFLIFCWFTIIYSLATFLIFKYYKLVIKEKDEKSTKKTMLIVFIIFYNIFVYFFSSFVVYGCLHASLHERTPNRFNEIFVPHSEAINLYEEEKVFFTG